MKLFPVNLFDVRRIETLISRMRAMSIPGSYPASDVDAHTRHVGRELYRIARRNGFATRKGMRRLS